MYVWYRSLLRAVIIDHDPGAYWSGLSCDQRSAALWWFVMMTAMVLRLFDLTQAEAEIYAGRWTRVDYTIDLL